MSRFGWAYVDCDPQGSATGPTGSIQFLTGAGFTSGSHNLMYYTASATGPSGETYEGGTVAITGALIVKIRNSPNVPESIDVIPIEIKISGNSKELITIAGNVESIPAISIFSPSILVVIIWKCLVENAHQACTGNENPKSQAGTPINMAKTNQMGSLLSIAGNKPKNAVITVNENTIHRVEVGGISRGGESFTK